MQFDPPAMPRQARLAWRAGVRASFATKLYKYIQCGSKRAK